MSDRYNPLGVSGLYTPNRTNLSGLSGTGVGSQLGGSNSLNYPGQLSDYEQQLQPFYQAEESADLQERRQIQPLRMLFDLLQRGQYASANIAREILRGNNLKEILSAAWAGITGKEKTSYEDVIREFANKDWAENKWFKNAPEGSWRSQVDNAKVFGLLGDIFLDPTTYIGFGASKGAASAARAYADDVVKVVRKELIERTGKEAGQAVLGKNVTKLLDDAWRAAYRKGLRETPEQLTTGLLGRVDELGDVGRGGLDDLVTALQGGNKYQRAGESAWNFGLLGRSQAGSRVRPAYNQAMRTISTMVKENSASTRLMDVWWHVMNQGPIGKIRELLNMPNAYQKVVRMKELEATRDFLENAQADMAREVTDLVRPMSDETKQTVVNLFSDAEVSIAANREARRLAKQRLQSRLYNGESFEQALTAEMGKRIGDPAVATRVQSAVAAADPEKDIVDAAAKALANEYSPVVDIAAMLQKPEVIQQIGEKNLSNVTNAINQVKELTEGWYDQMTKWVEGKYLSSVGEITDYLPTVLKTPQNVRRTGASVGRGTTQRRVMTKAAHTEADINKIMWVFGMDRDQAMDMLSRTGVGTVVDDLQEMLLARGIAQTKMAQRVNAIEQFKEFGIPRAEMPSSVDNWWIHSAVDAPEVGLRTVNAPGFENLLFDYDVAKAAERAMGLVAPKNINAVQQLFRNFTSFWKGVVTMTPGFHLRNFYSNEIMMMIKHGASTFNPKNVSEAWAGVVYALNKGDLKRAAKEFGMDDNVMARLLQKRRGNFTIQELADEALKRNVISHQIMGQDAAGVIEEFTAKANVNPLSKNFAGRKASRWAGEHVENMARFQSFLMDYGDTAGRSLDNIGDVARRADLDKEALDYSAMEAKKWFMDYGDLSEFERNTLKNVIPFYSWLRKNIANQIQAIALYPELFSLVPKLEDYFTYEHPDYDPDLIPEWMKNMGMFPTGQLEDGSFRMFNPNFPYQDLNRIPLMWEEGRWLPKLTFQEAKDDIVNAMHPAVKTLMSVATENGYNFFYKSELGEDAPAPYLMRLLATNLGIVGMIDGIQRARGLPSPIHIDENDKITMNAKTAQLLEDNMPLLRWFEFLLYLPQQVIPGLEDFLERKPGANDEYEGMEETLQLMSYYAGIKFKPVDLEEEKVRIGRDLYYKAVDALSGYRRTLPGSETRRMEYNNRIDQSIRRLRG